MSASYFPVLPPHVPARGTALSKRFFRQLFLAQGWSFSGELPDLPKAVAIISPHTSNIDAWHGFITLLGLGMKITVFGKHTLFNTPLKPLLKWIGVIPVNRTSPQGLTEQIIQIIQAKTQIWIGMAPEGTRKNATNMKSGFYHIAVAANIPIVMFAFDYDEKMIRCLGVFYPSGDLSHDLPKILACYAGQFSAKNPEWLAKPLQTLVKK